MDSSSEYFPLQEEILGEILGKEVRRVNYQHIINGNRVVFIGENHSNASIRDHLGRNAQDLRVAGITHFVIEAPYNSEPTREVIARLNRGEILAIDELLSRNIELGPSYSRSARRAYAEMLLAISKVGIKIIPVDTTDLQEPVHENTNYFAAKKIADILDQEANSKIIVLYGGLHIGDTGIKPPQKSKYLLGDTIPSHLDKIDSSITHTSIFSIGGSVNYDKTFKSRVHEARLQNEEFVIQPPQSTPYKGFDLLLHLPER